jgi:2'-5' RNA ligase
VSLFLAVRPDEGAVDDLQDALDRVRRLPLAEQLRWQPPSQWHVTLAFFGDPDPLVVDEVAERLGDLGSLASAPGLRVTGAGCFGRQILWMGLGDEVAVAGLREVVRAVPGLVRGTGVDLDRREWRPHLTVARARHGDARPTVGPLADYRGPAWSADEVVLIRSTGGPASTHHVVTRVDLARA